MKNTSKYVFLESKCCEKLSKSGQNTHNPCAKHFFEVCIGFRATLGHIKVYKLDFEIFMIFGHSDTISSIWKSLFCHHFWWKNSIWALRNSWKRFLTFFKLDLVRNTLLCILSTHTPKSAQYWLRKIDFSIFAHVGVWWAWELAFAGRNFKSAKQGQSVQKSRKSGFRDNTFYRGLIGQRIVSDTQKNV